MFVGPKIDCDRRGIAAICTTNYGVHHQLSYMVHTNYEVLAGV